MHICIIAHIFPARSETFVLQHVLGMRQRGHQVTVISKSIDDSISSAECAEIDRAGVSRIYIGNFPRAKVNWLLALLDLNKASGTRSLLARGSSDLRRRHLIAGSMLRWLKKLAPEAIHIHFGTNGDDLLAHKQGKNLSSRSVVTWHGYDFNAKSIVSEHDGYSALRDKNIVHTVGTWFSAGKLKAFGIKESDIRKIPMGIDLTRFRFQERDYLDNSVLKILSIGRMVKVKGHEFLLSAIAEARRRGVPAQLRIVGDGPLRSQLVAQVEMLQIGAYVEFLGALPSKMVPEEMYRAHLFALTGVEEPNGKVENQGTVYCEAAATGLACIGSGIGGVPEAVIEDVTGKLCRPADPDDIADAIQYFHCHRDVMARFGRSARRHAEENFQLEKMLDGFEAIYAELSARR